MLSEKEKRVGRRMLIIGAFVLVAIILFRVMENKSRQGVRGTGVSDGTERASMLPVEIDTPSYYASALGGDAGCSLAQPAAYGVVSELVRETNVALTLEEQAARQAEIDARDALEVESADLADIASRSTSEVFAEQSRYLGDTDLESDDISFTSNFVPLLDVVNGGELASWGVHYEYSSLDGTRALTEGSRSDDNSIERLYSEVIASSYKEDTYCAYSVSSNGINYLGGNEALCILLDEALSTEDAISLVESGKTVDAMVEDGDISLVDTVVSADGNENIEFHSIGEKVGIGYNPYFVETLGADEQLSVVHLVGDTVYVENYAVGAVTRIEYELNPEKDEVQEDGTIIPGADEIVSYAFSGYYCW